MSDKLPAVEKMIEKVQKKKDLTRNAAIDYMLAVATGRLAALWRYEDSVPDGKTSKGILQLAGTRKKRAPKTKKILPLVGESEPKKRATNESKGKKHKPKNAESKKVKAKKGVTNAKQTTIDDIAEEVVAAE